MTFKLNDVVVVKNQPKLGTGTIVEIDGNTLYLELRNGVEMEFNMTEVEYPVKRDSVSAEWMFANIGNEAIELAQTYYNAIYVKGFPNATPWNKMSNTQRLDQIAALAGCRNSQTLKGYIEANTMDAKGVLEAINKRLIDSGNKKRLERNKRTTAKEAVVTAD